MAEFTNLSINELKEFAHAVYASGTREACVAQLNVIDVSDGVHTMLYIPWRGEQRLPFGHTRDTSPTATYDYVCAHGTGMDALGSMLSLDPRPQTLNPKTLKNPTSPRSPTSPVDPRPYRP